MDVETVRATAVGVATVDITEVLAPVRDLGAFIREQREHAQISLRQLAKQAGVSNPYLSQVERGLRRPSAEILAQIAHGLQISVESLLTMAGILDEPAGGRPAPPGVDAAISADPVLTDRQKDSLREIYLLYRRESERGLAPAAGPADPNPAGDPAHPDPTPASAVGRADPTPPAATDSSDLTPTPASDPTPTRAPHPGADHEGDPHVVPH